MLDANQDTVTLIVIDDDKQHHFEVERGVNLRQALLKMGLSPYAMLTKRLNCGGRGLCATCGVWIEDGSPKPEHWHDRIGSRFGYPRLSCQVNVRVTMTVRLLTNKWVWGSRRA